MTEKKVVPKKLWYFGLVYIAELLSRILRGKVKRTGYKEVTSQTPDIGEYLDFKLYDLVWWWDQPDKPNGTYDPRRLAHCIGISHRVDSEMCYWLITDTVKLVSNTPIEHIMRDDYLKP